MINQQLEGILYIDNNEMGIIDYFRRNKHEEDTSTLEQIPQNTKGMFTRRDFIKNTAIAGAGIAITDSIIKPAEALASVSTPRGILDCRKRNDTPQLIDAWYAIKKGAYSKAFKLLGLSNNGLYSLPEHIHEEPAWMFLTAHIGTTRVLKQRYRYNETFYIAITNYVGRYSPHAKWTMKSHSSDNIERKFLATLFHTAKLNQKDFSKLNLQYNTRLDYEANMEKFGPNQYIKMNLKDQETLMNQLYNKIEKQDFMTKLTALWSANCLTNHYWMNVKKDNDKNSLKMQLINKTEMGLAKNINIIVRGPPLYFNKSF